MQIVADDLRHAGGRHRDHLRRVERVGVGEAVDHVVEAAEHRGVFGHRRGHRAARLLEVARKMRAIIGDAALRAVDEAHRPLEAGGGEHRAERLAGLGGVDDQRLAGEVLLAVLPGLGVFGLLGDLGVGDAALEHRLLAGEHLLYSGSRNSGA